MKIEEIKRKIIEIKKENDKERIDIIKLRQSIQKQADEISTYILAKRRKIRDEVPEEVGEKIPGFLPWKETNDFFKIFN